MGEATVSAAASEAATDPSWTDVVSALGAVVAALAAVATVIVAVVAALYAKRQVEGLREQLTLAGKQVEGAQDQLKEARTLRREQAQPYVVVYAVPSRVNPQMGEIVIKNFGTTGARDVTIECTPTLVRTDGQGGSEEVRLPAAMPFLAPGQEWRTFWDSGIERKDSGLPDRFSVTVTYTDSFGETHTTPAVLDWGVFRQRMWVTEKTVHNAAKSLESIDKTLKASTRADRIQRVATYDGPELDRQRAEEWAARIQRHEKLVAELTPEQAAPGRSEDGQP